MPIISSVEGQGLGQRHPVVTLVMDRVKWGHSRLMEYLSTEVRSHMSKHKCPVGANGISDLAVFFVENCGPLFN